MISAFVLILVANFEVGAPEPSTQPSERSSRITAAAPLTFYGAASSALQVHSILLYVESVQSPGDAQLRALGTTAVATITSPGWVEFIFRTPLTLPTVSVDFTLTPQGTSEFTLHHLARSDERRDVHLDRYTGPRVRFFELNQAGFTGLARLINVPDNVPSGCAAPDTDEVAGFPYVHLRVVPPDGGTHQQRFVLSTSQPSLNATAPVRFLQGVYPYPSSPSGSGLFIITVNDGGSFDSTAALDPLGFSPVVSRFDDAGISEPFSIALAADAGDAAQWRRYDVGDVELDRCHPAVRATYGGDLARAVDGPPGSDYTIRLDPPGGKRVFVDRDLDLSGSAEGQWIRAFATLDGFSLASGDCNDLDAEVHPDAVERCNGIDDDCDGVVDDSEDLELARCENWAGACLGSHTIASQCVSGAWQQCTANEYPFRTELDACDGLDNNCNGRIDECDQQRGVCAGAMKNCTGDGQCAYPVTWEAEESRCDGLDNDCDGFTDADDEGLVLTQCELTVGVCAPAVHERYQCTASGWSSCGEREYGPRFEFTEVTRDGFDNDCDGQVDEGLADQSSCGCTSMLGGAGWMVLLVLLRGRRR